MGSVFRHEKRWRAQVVLLGKRKSKIFNNKRDAIEWCFQMENTNPEAHTVEQLLNRYLDEVSVNKASGDKELLRFERFKREFPQIASLKLSEVNSTHWDFWAKERSKTVSNGTILRELNSYRNAFKVAIKKWKWEFTNPFDTFQPPVKPAPRDRLLTVSELRQLLENASYTRNPKTKIQEVGLIVMVALRTGMRAGEILQLGKDNVNLKSNIIIIKSHKTRHLTGKDRIIPITPKAVRLFEYVKDKPKFFSVSSQSLDALFRKVRDRVGIKDLHFHDTRATALTMLSKYLDPMDLAKVSGHKDLNILLNTYYRKKPEDISKLLKQKLTP